MQVRDDGPQLSTTDPLEAYCGKRRERSTNRRSRMSHIRVDSIELLLYYISIYLYSVYINVYI